MSWEHEFIGFSAFEGFVAELQKKGVNTEVSEKPQVLQRGPAQDCSCSCGYDEGGEIVDGGPGCPHCTKQCKHYQPLRRCEYTSGSGRRMVVEEYLLIDDHDCDGESIVGLSIHPAEITPLLRTQEFDAA